MFFAHFKLVKRGHYLEQVTVKTKVQSEKLSHSKLKESEASLFMMWFSEL